MAILGSPAARCIRNGISSALLPILLALLPAAAPLLRAQAPVSREYAIKAAFLLNFAQFVEWPPAAFPDPGAPLRIGVLGDDPFGEALEKTVQGETIHNRKLVVLRSHRVDDLKNCQLIFISKSEKGRMPAIMSQLSSSAALTVSETAGFAEVGGDINFYIDDNKVRFEINPTAARQEGLKISSQLLRLGKIVGSQPRKAEE